MNEEPRSLPLPVLEKLAALDDTRAAEPARREIRRLLGEGSDVDIYKINAHKLAADAETTVEEALRALLFATRLGLFDLNYDVYCPECRGNTEYAAHLMGLKSASHCNLCRIDFDLRLLDQIEVTFTVNSGVRAIDFADFSARDQPRKVEWFEKVAGRHGRFPPLKAYFEAPGTTLEESGHLEAGTYAAYIPAEKPRGVEIVVAGAPAVTPQALTLIARQDGSVEASTRTLRPGPVALTATSHFPRPWWPILVLPQTDPPRWISAAFVTSQQDFRDLFSGEFLAPGVTFAITSTTLMFTDIRSSTEMFEELGDSPAFALVQDHFGVMTDIIRAHRGGIVKTIGDAVMASFPRNVDGVRAAVEIQRAFGSRSVSGRRIEVKVGLHRGPAISVTSNRNLDYFGRTVNMAARVQGKSLPAEVMLSDAVIADPDVARYLDDEALPREELRAALKGIGDDFRLTRVRVR